MTPTPAVPETEDRRYRRIGIIVLIGLVLVVGVWGSIAPLSSAVSAPGKVAVATYNRTIQHLEGGIVKTILVKDGDQVRSGQVLIELDATRADAELRVALAQYTESLAQEARLVAERDAKLSIAFPSELDELCRNYPCTSLIRGQTDEFNARSSYIRSEREMLTHRIEQLRHQSEGLKQIIGSNSRLSDSYAQEIKEWRALFEQQLTDKLRLREIERQKIKTDGDIANARADMARLQGQIAEIESQIQTQKRTFDKEVTEKLSEVQTRISDLRSRITALRDTLARTRITTPVGGTVANLKIHTIGGVIPATQPIVDIVPAGEKLIVEGRVSATDINYVHPGLKAEIRFPGFVHIKTLKIVEGEVIHIAADAVVDETTHALYYPVKIAVTPAGLSELARSRLSLQPGFPADAMIVTGSRTMFDYLIHPIKMMFVKSFNEQ